MTSLPSAMITARFMRFSNSRTLPGQFHASIAARPSGDRPVTPEFIDFAYFLRKCWASRLASPVRSASAGIIEILAETPLGDHRVDILVRRTDDPGVDRDWLAPPDPLDHALLQEAQQLHLKGQGNVADLVEEQGTALGLFDLALGGLDRAREGALFMPKQLAFE